MTQTSNETIFEAVGGHPTFTRLVDVFYEHVDQDEVLIAMYPEGHDLTGAKHRLQMFLEQYFGGPTTYQEERGHPRLRMRHVPFAIGVEEARAWFGHMEAAVRAEELPAEVEEQMLAYFANAAGHMINA